MSAPVRPEPGRPEPGRPRVLVVLHEERAGLGRLQERIAEVAALDVRQPYQGEALPTDLSGHAGLVVLGGSMAAMDDDFAPWLPATRRLLAAGVEADLPTLGICLGAQLLAVATGGRVERGSQGLEVGVVPISLQEPTTVDRLFSELVERLGRVPLTAQFHQDGITELPPGAVLLAAGQRYPHQAFRLGNNAWGLQYHPEVTATDFAGWLSDGHGSVQAAGLDGRHVEDAYLRAEPALASLAQAHAHAFAGLLVPAAQTGPLRPS